MTARLSCCPVSDRKAGSQGIHLICRAQDPQLRSPRKQPFVFPVFFSEAYCDDQRLTLLQNPECLIDPLSADLFKSLISDDAGRKGLRDRDIQIIFLQNTCGKWNTEPPKLSVNG